MQLCPSEASENDNHRRDCEIGFISSYCGDMVMEENEDSSDEEIVENPSLEEISLTDSSDTENPIEDLSSSGDESLEERQVMQVLQDVVMNHNDLFAGTDSNIAELVDVLRSRIGDDLSELTPRIRRRVKDFDFAQKERSRRQGFQSSGIISLFSNLSDIRSDLRWAEDAAWRRENGMPYISWRDFEEKRKKGLQRPYLMYCLVVIYVVLMIICFAVNDWKIEPMRENPFAGPSAETLLQMGALSTEIMIETGSWYRLLSATFLHGGIIHIVANSAAMIFLGGMIECNHGIFTTFVIFFVPAIGASILSALMQPQLIMVGASGGLFAMIGICLADIFLNWKLLFLVFKNRGEDVGCWKKFRTIFLLLVDLFLQILIGLTPYVDNFAHLGGLIYGFLLGLAMLERLPLAFFGEGSRRWKHASYRLVGFAMTTVCLVLSSVTLSQSDGIKPLCYSCRAISCAPFPFWTEDKWWTCDWCNYVEGDVMRSRSDAFYSELIIMCPNGEVARTDISEENYTDKNEVAEVLPDYCRMIC